MEKRIIGIYRILNNSNNKCYIGSAISIKQRFRVHKTLLKKDKHFNNHLQAAWNKCGEDCFKFEILEETNLEILKEKEESYIKLYNSNNSKFGYNKRIDCSTNLGIKYSDQSKEKIRISQLGQKKSEETKEKIAKARWKSVIQMNMKGELIKKFTSLKEAAEKMGIHRSGISACCRNKLMSCGGFMWCFERDTKNFKPKIDGRTTRKIRKKKNVPSFFG